MAVSKCKINFQGPNGGYLMMERDGTLRVSTADEPGNNNLIFEQTRVGMDENNQKVLFSMYNKTKYISGYITKSTVTGEPTMDGDKLVLDHSYWVLKSHAEFTESDPDGKVALYHPNTKRYFIIKHDKNTTDLRLSTEDDVRDYGAFVLESLSDD